MIIIMPSVRMPTDHKLSQFCKNLSSSDKVENEDGKRSAQLILRILWILYAFVLFVIGIKDIFDILFILGITDVALRLWQIRTSLLFVPICLWSFVFSMFPIADWALTKLGM